MNKIIFFLIILFSVLTVDMEAGWIRTYGGAYNEEAYAVMQTADFGYIIGGYTDSYGAGFFDVFLVKTDCFGDTQWTRTYGGSMFDYTYSVINTTEQGYLLAGETNSMGAGNFDIYIIKTDSVGDTIWTRTFGGSNVDRAKSVVETNQGGYLMVGGTNSSGLGELDLCILKINSSGDSIWWKNYGNSLNEFGSFISPTTDNCFIIAGYTESMGAGQKDVYLIKIDSIGDTVWSRCYGGGDDDYGYSVHQTEDNGFVICGYTASFGNGDIDVYLIKTDSTGDSVWAKTYGGIYCDFGHSAHQTADKGYLIAGYTDSYGAGGYDVFIIKTDSCGDTLWTKTFGESSMDVVRESQFTDDGGFIFAGGTNSLGSGGYDMYLIKTDSNGSFVQEIDHYSPHPEFYQINSFGRNQIKVDFFLSDYQQVCLNIYDATGRCIFTPVSGNYSPGNYQYIFNVERSGLFIYSIDDGNVIKTGKLIVF